MYKSGHAVLRKRNSAETCSPNVLRRPFAPTVRTSRPPNTLSRSMPAPTITSRSAVSREGILRTCVQPQMPVPKTPPAQNLLGLARHPALRWHCDLEIADGQDLQDRSGQPDLLSRMADNHCRAATAATASGSGKQPRRHDAQTTTHPRGGSNEANPRRTRGQRAYVAERNRPPPF